MTLTEALKLTNTVRRKAWGNKDYYLRFTDSRYTSILDNKGNEASGLSILDCLGKEGLLADDWQALVEIPTGDTVKINGKDYIVKE